MREKTLPWLEMLEALFRRWRWVAAFTLLALVYGLVSVLAEPQLFRAQSRILLSAQSVPGPREAAMPEKQVKAEIALLKSPRLIRRVLEAQGVGQEDPVEVPHNPVVAFLKKMLPPERTLEARAESLARRVQADQVAGSNLVEVAIVDDNPEWAARFVNDLLAQHVVHIGLIGEQSNAHDFFATQRELLAKRWQEARSRVSQFRESKGEAVLAHDYDQMRGIVAQLESQLVTAQTQVLELQARADYLREEVQKHPETIEAGATMAEDESVRVLRTRILELEMERSELLSRFTPQSTLVRDIDRRILEARNLLETKAGETLAERTTAINPSHQALEVDIVQTEAQLTAAKARVDAVRRQVERYRDSLAKVEVVSGELERLEAEVANAQEAYEQYAGREEEARFESAISASGNVNVSVVEPAEVPTSPEPRRSGLRIAVLTLLGLGVGVVAAIGRDLLDPTICSVLRVSRVTDLPVAARIPAA